jgi:hypothetical protein
MATWRDHIATAENIVDGYYGESVQILPYKKDYMQADAPDTSRTIKDAKVMVIGRGTSLKHSTPLYTQRAEADMVLSIQDKYLGDTKLGDRVKLIERNNELVEISYTEQGTNGRSVLHVLRQK